MLEYREKSGNPAEYYLFSRVIGKSRGKCWNLAGNQKNLAENQIFFARNCQISRDISFFSREIGISRRIPAFLAGNQQIVRENQKILAKFCFPFQLTVIFVCVRHSTCNDLPFFFAITTLLHNRFPVFQFFMSLLITHAIKCAPNRFSILLFRLRFNCS